MQLKGKSALITGAGSGIGEAAAILFAQEGASVLLIGRTAEELEKVARKITSSGGKAFAFKGDVTSENDMKRAVETAVREFGRLDIIFANAGVNGVWAPVDELTLGEWNNTININLTGTFLPVKYGVPELKKHGGAIVITSSVNGTRMFSNSGASAYASTKAAQVAFAKMIAVELARYKIRVNVICPGAIKTEIDDNTQQRNVEKVKEPVEFPEGEIPLTDGTPGTSEQVARLVLFLSSDQSSHITGTEMWIDGGQSLLQG